MATLFNVSLRTSEPEDQEVAQALFRPCAIVLRVHRAQNIIIRNLPIDSGDQAGETVLSND